MLGYGGGNSNVTNCYNIGNVSAIEYYGGISAGDNKNKVTFINNYWLNTCGTIYGKGYEKNNINTESKNESEIKALAENLGDEYVTDGKIKDANGNWIDNKDKEGNIIYINNGYPILKWQVTEI